MTNAMIILYESVKLMEAGVLKGTGRYVEVQDKNGETKRLEIPEAIHTYNAWKDLGYQAKKGEKAVAQFTIWKYRAGKHNEETDEVEQAKMFMKKASFFTAAQVQAIA